MTSSVGIPPVSAIALMLRYCRLATWSFIKATKGDITRQIPSFIREGT